MVTLTGVSGSCFFLDLLRDMLTSASNFR
jgi:hypothetical protein